MAAGMTALDTQAHFEDILSYLPTVRVTEYARRQAIYAPDNCSTCLYLVISGKVGISKVSPKGHDVLLEVVRPEEVFGESAFLGTSRGDERATALENVKLMNWDVSIIKDLLAKRPRLALGLVQSLALRNAELSRRVESFSDDNVRQRLARALIRLSERLGTAAEDGSTSMMPLTHNMLSRYIGSSRELVTHYMNVFRAKGYLNYSRTGICLFSDSLRGVFE